MSDLNKNINEDQLEAEVQQEMDMVAKHMADLQKEAEAKLQAQREEAGEDATPQWYGKQKKRVWRDVLRTVLILLGVSIIVLAVLHCRGLKFTYQAELGEGRPDASVFFKDGTIAEYKYGKDVSLTEEGNYLEVLTSDRWLHLVLLKVRDTTAPYAENAALVLTTNNTAAPEDAVTNVVEASSWTAEWVDEPVFGSTGVINTTVKITDSYENFTEVPVSIIVFEPVSEYVWEMGSPRPVPYDFVTVRNCNISFVTDMDTIDWDHMGEYEIELSLEGDVYTSILKIVDGIAPVLEVQNIYVNKNDIVSPEDFVVSCTDDSAVTLSFTAVPDTTVSGLINVGILATDDCGNETEARADMTVLDKEVNWEAGSEPLTDQELMTSAGYSFDQSKEAKVLFTPDVLETRYISLVTSSAEIFVKVNVVDTTAPTADIVYVMKTDEEAEEGSEDSELSEEADGEMEEIPAVLLSDLEDDELLSGFCGYEREAAEFVTNIQDATEVTTSWKKEPDWNQEGRVEGTVRLTDAAGNYTDIEVGTFLTKDTEAPQLFAGIDRYYYVGDAVSYMKGVYALDNADPEVEIEVDKSEVNQREVGSYSVTYTATDKAGNVSTQTVDFYFQEPTVTDEELEQIVSDIFDEIFTEGMSVAEQAEAINNYVYDQIIYTGWGTHGDWKAEAYRAYTEGVGDCYTFFSLAYLLLQHIDCEVIPVERYEGSNTDHYWCLVNLGTGWYHFDAINVSPEEVHCFMFTQEQCEEYSWQFWHLDEWLYPAVATDPFEMF